MKRLFFLLLFFLCALCIHSQYNDDSLLRQLDKVIKERPLFSSIKEFRIDSLRKILKETASDLNRKYALYGQIFQEYSHYNLDSALSAAKCKNMIAEQINNRHLQYESRMNIAEMLGKMGMYKETFDIMKQIKKSDLTRDQWSYYFHLYHSIYSLLLQNALSQEEKGNYKAELLSYKDSLLGVLDTGSLAYKLILSGKLVENGKNTEALALMQACYNNSGKETEKNLAAFGLSEIYEKMGDTDLQKHYLSISALADLRRSIKSYIALRKLAVVLYREGDLNRAYAYIKCAMEDASFAKARFRMIEISEALPIIVASYDKKMKEDNDNLFKYFILISILSIVLLVCIGFIYKQLSRISSARLLIDRKNEELITANEALKEVNKKLSESDNVKETYIAYVFKLCSSYIDKLENYRLDINKKLKARQIDEALRLTGSSSFVTNELKDFFQNFDAVFLNIYPNFIEEFNRLLKNEERISPKSGDILTPELRVFALVRLGISDSSKIADFLHYSPQTVYNYKLKIRNKLAVSKEEFSVRILQIGL